MAALGSKERQGHKAQPEPSELIDPVEQVLLDRLEPNMFAQRVFLAQPGAGAAGVARLDAALAAAPSPAAEPSTVNI